MRVKLPKLPHLTIPSLLFLQTVFCVCVWKTRLPEVSPIDINPYGTGMTPTKCLRHFSMKPDPIPDSSL